ncbi:MAG TPA: ABC transporter substrate-binding protein, partial [bacterium]|nr:ABC transporter substrate-binding protein [bacterium]
MRMNLRLHVAGAAQRGFSLALASGRCVAFVLVCVMLAGCGGGSASKDAVSATPVDGGTCVIGVFGDFDSFNEFVSTDANATTIMERMLYMPLFEWTKDLSIQGRLAKSWEYSPDSLDITVHLRPDIRWHDGVPTTAYDVKYTF